MEFETEHGELLSQRHGYVDPLLDVEARESLDSSEENNLGDQFLSPGVISFSADVLNYRLIFPLPELVPLCVLME